MTARKRDSGKTADRIDRRTLLKGTAAVGLTGTGMTGTATADDTIQAEELPHRITIEAGDSRVSYKFRVSGQVAKAPEAGTLGVDTIEENVVRGEVGGSLEGNPDPVDDYAFSGAIAFVEASGPMTVTLDITGRIDDDDRDDDDDDKGVGDDDGDDDDGDDWDDDNDDDDDGDDDDDDDGDDDDDD